MREKQDSVTFQRKHNKNNVFVVDQNTIAANEPKQVYIVIKQIKTILMAHHR